MSASDESRPTFRAVVYRDNHWFVIGVSGGTFSQNEEFWTQATNDIDVERMARDLISTLEDRPADSFDLAIEHSNSRLPI